MKLSDFKGLLKKSTIKLIEKRQETRDIYVFVFESKSRLRWKAGQHGVFKFKGEKFNKKNVRAFSVASISQENKIMFGTRISDNPSDFKMKLKSMQIGDFITMIGPFGWFYISVYEKPMALIAGGIGIPPIRSLLKDIEAESKISKSVEVFYIDDKGEYAFKDEIEYFDKKYDFIKVHFLQDREDFNARLDNFRNKHGNKANYFISGTPKMIESLKSKLIEQGIGDTNIIYDDFKGCL